LTYLSFPHLQSKCWSV